MTTKKAQEPKATNPLVFELDAPTRQRLLALTDCASKDNYRPVLAAVCFGEGIIAATDAYVAAYIECPTFDGQPNRSLPAAGLRAALKVKASAWRIAFHDDHAIVTTEYAGSLFEAQTITTRLTYPPGPFPDVRKLVPPIEELTNPGRAPHIDVEKLRRVAAVAGEYDGLTKSPVSLHWKSAKSAIVVTRGTQVIGVVMPIANVPEFGSEEPPADAARAA